jgi:hypothetical protein
MTLCLALSRRANSNKRNRLQIPWWDSGMLILRHAPDHHDQSILRHCSRANGTWNKTGAIATYSAM